MQYTTRNRKGAGWVRRKQLSLLVIVGLASLPAELMAVCVSDQAGFAVAAANAALVPTTIELVQGTYEIAGTAFDVGPHHPDPFQGFSLLGGFTAGCASRTIDPGNTTITLGADDEFYVDVVGDVTIEGIGFTGASAGFAILWEDSDHSLPSSVSATIRRNSVSGGGDNSGINIEWEAYGSQTLSARIVENLFHNNVTSYASQGTCGGGSAIAFLYLNDSDGGSPATWTLINNTIANNTFAGGVCAYGGNVQAYNNILYGNNGPDLFVSGAATAVLGDNVIGSHLYNGSVSGFGTLTGDPKLNAQYHPIESPPSPVINSGDNTVPGGLPAHDLTGGARVVGSTVDRGAFESSIDDSFIQTVTNTNDSGTGSLRAAINSINANNSGLVKFAIGSSCGPQVITLNSALPAITSGGVINGYTQPGSSANDLDIGDDATVCVILEAGSGGVATGLSVPSGAGDADTLTIEGLAFGGFSSAAIDLEGGSDHLIAGNHFGGNVGGHSLQSNHVDIQLGPTTHDVLIGGDDDGDRNIIGDAGSNGIWLQGGASGPLLIGTYNDQIINNYIGVGWNPNTGTYTNRGNGSNGVRLDGHDNTLSGNLIGDNAATGVVVNEAGAENNVLDGNFIGLSSDGMGLPNPVGVHFAGSAGDAPSANTVRDNTIADNTQQGVWVEIGQGNKLRRNRVFLNGALGIDLAAKGVMANDDDAGIQATDYANRGLNYPVLATAGGGYQSGWIAGSLTSTGGDYTLDFFENSACDGSGHGQGENWIGSGKVTVTVPVGLDEGTSAFSVRVTIGSPFSLRNGWAIATTVTDASGNTSEFSSCISYDNDTIFANGFEPPPA